MTLSLSADEARRFLVLRHGLAAPRSRAGDARAPLAVTRMLGALQFDPLEVPGARNHDLVLHARIRGYRRGGVERWLYAPSGERQLFEAYNKSLNILPLEDLPAHRFAWERARLRHETGLFTTPASTVKAVLDRLRAEGPTSTRTITKAHGGAVDWYWAPTALGRAILEALFETGQVAIVRREGNARIYDLAERLFPDDLLAIEWSRAQRIESRLLTRHRSVGLLGRTANAEVFIGLGDAAERERARAALVERGELVPVRVEGQRELRHLVASEVSLLSEASVPLTDAQRGVTFCAPLDPLLWDRRLVETLFGFTYRWEVYTAAEKREHGYYVLPVLFGDAIVGRIEPVFHRKTSTLEVRLLSFVEGFVPTADALFLPALVDALRDYTAFVGATTVKLGRTRFERAVAKALAQRLG